MTHLTIISIKDSPSKLHDGVINIIIKFRKRNGHKIFAAFSTNYLMAHRLKALAKAARIRMDKRDNEILQAEKLIGRSINAKILKHTIKRPDGTWYLSHQLVNLEKA